MQFINVRQLLSNYEEATKNLPVTVTRYGRPIFKIFPLNPDNLDTVITNKAPSKTLTLEDLDEAQKILEKKIVEPVMKVDPSEEPKERHVCSWDRTFKCTSPGTVFTKGKWWCTPHGLEA